MKFLMAVGLTVVAATVGLRAESLRTITADRTSSEVGCQTRVAELTDVITPAGWYYGTGANFDYPGVAISMEVISFSAEVLRYNADGSYNPGGAFVSSGEPFRETGLFFYARYMNGASARWTTDRAFGLKADSAVNTFLVPHDQWWGAAYSFYSLPVLHREVLHVLVC